MTRTPANAVVVMFLLAAAGLITLGAQALQSRQAEREIAALPMVRMEQVVIMVDRARTPDDTVQAGNTATTTLR